MKSFSFFLEGGYLVVDHVHEDEPGFIMLRSLVGQVKTALLGKRFFCDVFRLLQTLTVKSNILEVLRIGSIFSRKILSKILDTHAGQNTETLSVRHVVKNLSCALPVAPGKIYSISSLTVKNTMLPAFHEEACHGSETDGIYTVGITIEVNLDNSKRIVHIEVGTHTCSCFVLRTVHNNLGAFVWTGLKFEVIHRMGTRHRASKPATVRYALTEEVFPDPAGNSLNLRITTVFMVFGR